MTHFLSTLSLNTKYLSLLTVLMDGEFAMHSDSRETFLVLLLDSMKGKNECNNGQH
jgi:hypothetical protein